MTGVSRLSFVMLTKFVDMRKTKMQIVSSNLNGEKHAENETEVDRHTAA